MFRILGLLVAFVLTATSVHAQTAPGDIVKVREAYMKAVNAGDPKAMPGLYTEDAVEMPPNQPLLKGRAAIDKYNTGFLTGNSVKLSLTGLDTQVSGDMAYDVGTYSQTITPKQGGAKPMTDRGKYVVIMRRDAAKQWRVRYAIYNSDLPPQPMPDGAKPKPAK